MQYKLPQNYELVKEALITAGREDLIGYDKKCLIRPEKRSRETPSADKHRSSTKSPSHNARGAGKSNNARSKR